MKAFRLAAILLAILVWPSLVIAQGEDDIRAEIQQIKQQLAEMDQLKARLAELEKRLDESQKAQQPAVSAGFKDEKVKIDGRIFIGLFDTGDQGTSPNGGADINDAKIRLTFNPSKNVTIVNRLSTTGAKSADFDYFYMDLAKALGPNNTLRIGQRKIDIGQETWVDSPEENLLISPSIPHVVGYGTGMALVGRFTDTAASPMYEAGFVNGSKGVMSRPTSSLPINLKLGAPLRNDIFASASYFDSGKLGASDKSAIGIAELTDAPAGATEWRRKIWELDVRYNAGNSGYRALIPSTDLPRFMAAAMFGAFSDDASGVPDRDGKFWYVEGLYGLSDRLYTVARYGAVDLDGGVLAALGKSPVAVNSYKRTSIGLGYRLTDLTHLKTEYSFNETSGGASEPSLDQWAFGVASKF